MVTALKGSTVDHHHASFSSPVAGGRGQAPTLDRQHPPCLCYCQGSGAAPPGASPPPRRMPPGGRFPVELRTRRATVPHCIVEMLRHTDLQAVATGPPPRYPSSQVPAASPPSSAALLSQTRSFSSAGQGSSFTAPSCSQRSYFLESAPARTSGSMVQNTRRTSVQ
jgi:hypothetical protein